MGKLLFDRISKMGLTFVECLPLEFHMESTRIRWGFAKSFRFFSDELRDVIHPQLASKSEPVMKKKANILKKVPSKVH